MALKEAAASNNSEVTPRERKIKSDNIQQYRKSRDVEDEVEKTTRRVVRITDDGEEEVKVRERKYQNGEKEQVVKRLSRENENKMVRIDIILNLISLIRCRCNVYKLLSLTFFETYKNV